MRRNTPGLSDVSTYLLLRRCLLLDQVRNCVLVIDHSPFHIPPESRCFSMRGVSIDGGERKGGEGEPIVMAVSLRNITGKTAYRVYSLTVLAWIDTPTICGNR